MLVILPGAIGDFIVTLPALHWLKHQLRPAWLELWTERPNLRLLESLDYIDCGVALAETPVDRWPPPQLLFDQLKKFDLVISWRGAQHQEWIEILRSHHSNIHFFDGFSKNCLLHAVDYRRAQIASLFGNTTNFSPFPKIVPSIKSVHEAREILSSEIAEGQVLVMVHPGASGAQKLWPAGHFAKLIVYLSARGCLGFDL